MGRFGVGEGLSLRILTAPSRAGEALSRRDARLTHPALGKSLIDRAS